MNMNKAASHLYNHTAKYSVKHRVERDIDSFNRKISSLENEPRSNDQLLAAYRLMLKTRTEVLACLTDSLNSDSEVSH